MHVHLRTGAPVRLFELLGRGGIYEGHIHLALPAALQNDWELLGNGDACFGEIAIDMASWAANHGGNLGNQGYTRVEASTDATLRGLHTMLGLDRPRARMMDAPEVAVGLVPPKFPTTLLVDSYLHASTTCMMTPFS